MHEITETKIKELRDKIEEVEKLDRHILDLNELFVNVTILAHYIPSLWCDLNISNKNDLEEKIKKLGKLKYFITRYYNMDKKTVYYFKNTEDGTGLNMIVYLSENASCKYVQIGVKTEPIYELKCE